MLLFDISLSSKLIDKTAYARFASPENSILLIPSSRDIRKLGITNAKMYQQ